MEVFLQFVYAPFLYPLDPSRRVFVLFLLTAALMVIISNYFSAKRTPLSIIFSKRLWLHPSSLLDARVMLTNSLIKGLLITPFLVGKLAIVLWVSGLLYQSFGSVNIQVSHHGLLIILFSLTLFVAEDASRFLQHRFMHAIPLLWQIHKIHHQAEVLTPLTLYRIHPIEIMISSWRSILVLGGITGVFVYLFPGQISALEILGVDAFGFLFNALGANLRHSPFPVSFGPLNRIFISPVMHQIHHSSDLRHKNKNFGSCLSLWDRLSGSYHIEDSYHTESDRTDGCHNHKKKNHKKLKFGCRDNCQHSLIKLYSEPVKQIKHSLSRGLSRLWNF